MLVLLGLAALGLLLMTFAADHLVIGAGRLAVRLRITPIVVGVVVIGVGTSAPEFLVTGLAAAAGESELALGNLVGSNIVNVTLVLGLAALIAPVAVRSSTLLREAPMSSAAVAVFAVAVWLGLTMVAGALLAAAMAAALWLLVRVARTTGPPPAAEAAVHVATARLGRETLRTLLGLAGTLAGAQLLVANAAELAARLGVSSAVIGFTLVAIGTSLPELVTAIQAQRRGHPDLVVGNLLGSNLFNSLGGGAVIAFAAAPGAVPSFGPALLAVMAGISLLAWLVLWRGVRRWEGAVLLLLYLACLPLLL